MNILSISNESLFQKTFLCVHPKKKEKRGYRHSGEIIVEKIAVEREYTFLEYTNHASKSWIGASANYLSSDKCCKCAKNMGGWSQAHTKDR